MHIKRLGLFVVAFLAASPVLFAQPTHTVSRVIDGATLELSNGERVRLIGVDCPEFKDQKRNRRNAERLGIELEHYASFAQKAKVFLKAMVEGKEVVLVFDDANNSINHRDKYGRVLAYVYNKVEGLPIEDYAKDDFAGDMSFLSINSVTIIDGYCTAYTRFDFLHKDKFLELDAEAKEQGRGMWG